MEQAAALPTAEVDVILPATSLNTEGLVEDLVIDDDRNLIQPNDSVVLVIEDDITFARILVDLAHEHGLKALAALRGSSAMSLAREFKPGAITLDINLPDMAGWTILDRLKHDPSTRHIPVHIISGDENRRLGMALGAMTYLEKSVGDDSLAETFTAIEHSVQKRVKKLLAVSSDAQEREEIISTLSAPDLDVLDVATGGEALAVMKQQYVDGIVMHFQLDDIEPLSLVEEIQEQAGPHIPPVILVCNRALTDDEELDLARLTRTAVVRLVSSRERLLDECVLLLHRAEADLRQDQRRVLEQLRESDVTLVGKKVLVVDDDVRNIFALTSLLEDHHLKVVHAENGRAGIEALKRNPDIDLVLMDIMMPEMDGYETMKAIRQEPALRSLPIIALTAKAMKGDRAKCIEAGASDYITKPVDLDNLFSVLRVWVSRGHELTQMAAPSI